MALCYCGKEAIDKYCFDCLEKREQFIATVVNDYNCSDVSAFEYLITDASEKIRVIDMTSSIGKLVDEYYLTSQEYRGPYSDNLFLERVYTLKVEMLERFLDLLGTSGNELIRALEIYYKNYRDRIRSDIEVTNNYLSILREGIVNSSKRVLTKES